MDYSKFSVPKGILMMALGYTSFALGVVVLNQLQPSDPHWFGMLIICLTWLSCFLVIGGFAYLAVGYIVRKANGDQSFTFEENQTQ